IDDGYAPVTKRLSLLGARTAFVSVAGCAPTPCQSRAGLARMERMAIDDGYAPLTKRLSLLGARTAFVSVAGCAPTPCQSRAGLARKYAWINQPRRGQARLMRAPRAASFSSTRS
ncbi:MAG: hypothetical protein IKP86_13265, partial [Anaerolineaceae bacterium]|nr:hypothetical protein [Anaerolineaceae bacterium]